MKKTIKHMDLSEFAELISTFDKKEYIVANDNNYQLTNYNIDYSFIFTNIIVKPERNAVLFKEGKQFFKIQRVTGVVLRTISGDYGRAIDLICKGLADNTLKYTVLINNA